MKSIHVSAAVALALAAASPSFALDPATAAAAPVQLVISGASAARDAAAVFITNTACAAGTVSFYRADPTPNQDFRAYACTIVNDAAYGTAAGQNAVVYYRAEGGSGWGPIPVAFNVPVKRLLIDADCVPGSPNNTAVASTTTIGSATVNLYGCPVTAYNLDTDGAAAGDNLVDARTELGISDEEPKVYAGANWISSQRLNPANSGVQIADRQPGLNAQTFSVGFGQSFGVIVNTGTGQQGCALNSNPNAACAPASGAGAPTDIVNSPFNGVTADPVLSKAALAGIFAGRYRNWNQVPTTAGGRVTASNIPVRVCRREPGSGTQVAGNAFFLGITQCGTPLANYVVDNADPDLPTSPLGFAGDNNGVIERGTNSDSLACIQNMAGGVGVIVANSAPAGTRFVAIDGISPTKNGAASGIYPFSYELTYQVDEDTAGADLDLANAIIAVSRARATVPNVNSAFALPNSTNLPFAAVNTPFANPPIALHTRGGNSCRPLNPSSP